MSEVTVKGLSELQKFLDELPAKMERNVMRGALRAGGNVIRDAAKTAAPVGPPSLENARLYGSRAGSLRDSLRVKTGAKGGLVTASVTAGGRGKWGDAYYAHFVEYGTRPHTITAANRKGLSFGGLFFQSVDHPGAKARPFMRPALDSRATAAVVAAGEYIKNRLATKHGLDTSDVSIEAEE